ncbi:MAG: 6-carboxytetrahydropterin synthase [Phycisphaerales bacterium]|nr:MAG: 6-carboxytetrahydropterin synthase [Phycisphaerales bacterium]
MFTISVETHFRASHQLILPDGSKEPLHDHDWAVTAAVSSDKLDEMGVVMDFHDLKAKLRQITAELDDTVLGEIRCFQRNNPSAENVAKHVYGMLRGQLPHGVKLRSIKVVEEPGCVAEFAE